jgi:hypothetical protein
MTSTNYMNITSAYIDNTRIHSPKEVQLGFFRCSGGCVLEVCRHPWWGVL